MESAQTKVKEGEDLVARQQAQILSLNKMVDDAAVKYNACQDQVRFISLQHWSQNATFSSRCLRLTACITPLKRSKIGQSYIFTDQNEQASPPFVNVPIL